ncbi:MAG: apolipoprotein N-acyltransferase [Candidatus Marinimicrobia bacterium]|nr:apolipoprotein N-acyltransferase [FCB group bacterium]MBL7023979.1 apolipoprotein N-acyltransferase [Candidatus Neomarinimicrobiota bacterium]
MKTIKPIYLLIIAAALIAVTHMRFGFGILIFLETIPILFYLDRTSGWRSKALLFGFLVLGWSLATLKIVTSPLPWFIAIGYGLPLATVKFGSYLAFVSFPQSKKTQWVFPTLMVMGEWLQSNFTPFGSWGAAANTQINNIVWLQILSIGGIWILSFVIYFIAYQIYEGIRDGFLKARLVKIAIPILVLSMFGTLRLTRADNTEYESLQVATVGTNSKIGGPELPSLDVRNTNRVKIFERMRIASDVGAKLVVWTEGATGLLPDEEADFQAEVSRLTDSLNITAVVSYVILISTEPFFYENKYIIIDSTGSIRSTYLKHEPVPGEPCTKGTEPHTVYNMDGTRLGGAICYDLDFPVLGRDISKLGADLVAVPSSDWRGIDPIHTQMAAMRAIEGGFSLIRSTRWGLSATVDPYGRVLGQLSDFNSDEKILVSSVPLKGQQTIYSLLGDWVILVGLFLLVYGIRRKSVQSVRR